MIDTEDEIVIPESWIRKPGDGIVKVVNRFRLKSNDYLLRLLKLEDGQYRIEVTSDFQGTTRVIRNATFRANSNRHATRWMHTWLNAIFPQERK